MKVNYATSSGKLSRKNSPISGKRAPCIRKDFPFPLTFKARRQDPMTGTVPGTSQAHHLRLYSVHPNRHLTHPDVISPLCNDTGEKVPMSLISIWTHPHTFPETETGSDHKPPDKGGFLFLNSNCSCLSLYPHIDY